MTEHRHRWVVRDFRWLDGRPMMGQHCDCGAERIIAAWFVTWEPGQSRPAIAMPAARPPVR